MNKGEREEQIVLESFREKNNKITEVNKYLLIITLIVDGLNCPYTNWITALINKIQLFVIYKKHTSLAKVHTN
jgi:hypothetical protein